MMIKMSDLFGLVDDLEKIRYGLRFEIFKRNDNLRALYRSGAVAADVVTVIRDIYLSVLSIKPKNDIMIIVQKVSFKMNNMGFGY